VNKVLYVFYAALRAISQIHLLDYGQEPGDEKKDHKKIVREKKT